MRVGMVALVMLLASPGFSSTGTRESGEAHRVQAEVKKVISRAVAARQQAFAETTLPIDSGPPPLWFQDRLDGLVVEDDLLRLARLSADPDPQHGNSMALLYLRAVESEMGSEDPMVRGMACQVAALTRDPRVIPAVASLVDDGAGSTPILYHYALWVLGFQKPRSDVQTALGHVFWTQPTVGKIARASLDALTSTRFATKADFDAWWKANGNYQERLWYWATRWSVPLMARVVPASRVDRAGGPDRESLSADVDGDLEILSRLPGDLGLKVILLYNNSGALQTEAELAFDDETPFRFDCDMLTHVVMRWLGSDDHYAPSLDMKAGYIREHGLKPKLIDLLQHKMSYPEVVGPNSFHRLVLEIASVGEKVFTPEDEPVLAAIARSQPKDLEVVRTLAILRSRITPERGRAILREAVRENPEMIEAAMELIRRFGAADAQVLKEAFAVQSGYWRTQMADALEYAANQGLPVSAGFLADLADVMEEPSNLAEMVDAPTDDYLGSSAFYSLSTLRLLARTGNQVMGRTVISDQELDSLRRRSNKGTETEETRIHNRQIPEAFRSVKAKLIAALREEGLPA